MIKSLAEAREHGDLSENAEYQAARERQSFIEGRIADLEDTLTRVEVIDVDKLTGKQIKFGATVTLADGDTDAEVTYQLVGEYEADISAGMLAMARRRHSERGSMTARASLSSGAAAQSSSAWSPS